MFPRHRRLASKRDIDEVHKSGKKRHGKFLMVVFRETGTPSRAAVVVSKKALKLATQRNRVKRQIREYVKPFLEKRTGDYLFYVKPSIRTSTPTLLKEDAQRLLENPALEPMMRRR